MSPLFHLMDDAMPNPFKKSADRRVQELGELSQKTGQLDRIGHDFYADPFLTGTNEALSLNKHRKGMSWGFIKYALPYMHWYVVQLESQNSRIRCCAMSQMGLNPIGVVPIHTYPVNTRVLVWQSPTDDTGLILGVIPEQRSKSSLFVPDDLVLGGGSGFHREAVHNAPRISIPHKGGTQDFSAGRPLDSTTYGEAGYVAETGIALLIDAFQAFLRVDETCGLFLSYFDHFLRLAGWNMDISSAVHELVARDDEGEAHFWEGWSTYPWEALGLNTSGINIFQSNDSRTTRYQKPLAPLEPRENLRPIYRYREFHGYLGQGVHRVLSTLGNRSNTSTFDVANNPDPGLFEEVVALDGQYGLRSAHSISIVKQMRIPVPMQLRQPEDQQDDSDGKEQANYKASSLFGDGEQHTVGNVSVTGDFPQLQYAANALDLHTYLFNWKGVHPFHYHSGDWQLPEDADLPGANQHSLNFDTLAGGDPLPLPNTTSLFIDHRYGDVSYFESMSYFNLTPDGGVAIGDGYGAELVLSGGSVYINAPGDIHVMAGRNNVQWGVNIVLKAKHSIDATATMNDIRLKAERNMQLLAGNGGVGGILLESRASGAIQSYDGAIGEEVVSSGVIIRCPTSQFATMVSGIYLRTGSDGGISEGDIVLDAAKGKSQIHTFSDGFNRFMGTSGARDSFGAEGKVTKVNSFSDQQIILSTDLTIGGNTFIVNSSSLLVEGNVAAPTGTLSAASDKVGKYTGQPLQQALAVIAERKSAIRKQISQTAKYEQQVEQSYYPDGMIGAANTQENVQFSFRDVNGGAQYLTQSFVLLAPRWQRMVLMGQGTGGTAWTEQPVSYQNNPLYPYPGQDAYLAQGLLIPSASTLAPDGEAARRDSGVYASPALSGWAPQTLNQLLTII